MCDSIPKKERYREDLQVLINIQNGLVKKNIFFVKVCLKD